VATRIKSNAWHPQNEDPARRPSAKQFRFGYLIHDVSRLRRIVMDDRLMISVASKANKRIMKGLDAAEAKLAEKVLFRIKLNLKDIHQESMLDGKVRGKSLARFPSTGPRRWPTAIREWPAAPIRTPISL
jgi:hypothetical protein